MSVEMRKARLNLIFDADRTKPAIDAVTVAIMTIAAVYQIELITH